MPRPRNTGRRPELPAARTRPGLDDPYDVVFFQRHRDDDPGQAVPGREFLDQVPVKVRARMLAVVVEVAKAPPHRFAGGGYWEAMHGDMTGYHEIRVNGPNRTHYRLFCLLDTGALGRAPLLVILCGASKTFRTTFKEQVYKQVRQYGEEFRARNPRSII